MSTTPTAGDVVVVAMAVSGAWGATRSVSGLGATWTEAYNRDTSANSDQGTAIWIGTGANASGNISVVGLNGRFADARAWTLRGVSSTIGVSPTVQSTNAAYASPVAALTTANIALGYYTHYALASDAPILVGTPSGDWTMSSDSLATFLGAASAYGVPAGSENLSITSTSSQNNGTKTYLWIVVGPAPPTPAQLLEEYAQVAYGPSVTPAPPASAGLSFKPPQIRAVT
jgi:hypothetical protein